MYLRLPRFVFSLLLAAAICGCSSQPDNTSQPAKTETTPKPNKVETNELRAGREALQTMYASARIWSGDAQPVSLTSLPRKGDAGGKATIWGASFASAGKRSIRNFMWSGAAGEDAPETGVSLGSIDTYSPDNASTRPIDMTFLKIDSNEAFETAQKHGGGTLLKKTPDALVKYQLIWEPRTPRLLWSIRYAPAGNEAKLNILINASTGDFLKIEK